MAITPTPNPPVVANPSQVSKETLAVRLGTGQDLKISRASLIIGETNTGKTLGAASLAEYLWKTFRKRLRLVTCEPGGYASVQTHIDLGLIEVADIAGQPNFMSKMSRLTRGYWPVWKENSQGRKIMLLNDPKSAITKETLEDIGGSYFDGITSACSQIMLQTTTSSATEVNIPGNPDQSKDGTMNQVTDGELTYRFAGMGHYSFIQNRINEYVTYTCGLPYSEVWWTALPKMTDAERTGKKIYGPAISGSAAVEDALSWFGRVVHVERVTTGQSDEDKGGRVFQGPMTKETREEVWMWLQEHQDPFSGGVYKCKMRQHIIGSTSMPRHFKVEVKYGPDKVTPISVDFFNVLFAEEAKVQAMTRSYLLDTLPDLGELQARSGRPKEMFEAPAKLSTVEIKGDRK